MHIITARGLLASLGLATLGLMTTFPARAVVAGGMASITREFTQQPGGYLSLDTRITIAREPGFNGRTYWAHQWKFVGPEGGYIGLQQRGADQKAINFSIWGATGWDAEGPTRCGFFGHEGSGVQCSAAFDWQEGATYHIRVRSTAQGRWTASITDTASGQTTVVATIHVPANYFGIKSLSEWVEDFAQGAGQHARCEDVPATVAVYGVPTLEGKPPVRSRPRTYGKCAHIGRASCSPEQVCTLSGNPPPPATAPFRLRHASSGQCLTLQETGQLQDCASDTGNGQWFGTDASHLLADRRSPDECLSAAAEGTVVADACFGSSRQHWLPVPRTQALYNPGTGLCLDRQERSARLAACSGSPSQQWQRLP